MPETASPAQASPQDAALTAALGTRCVVLVGMMGAGKSTIGRRIAARLRLPFLDADTEIEAAAGHGRSAISRPSPGRERSALAIVPATNPRVTAIDSQAGALADIQGVRRAGTTAVAENQRERAPSSARQIHASMRQRVRELGGASPAGGVTEAPDP